MAHSSRVDQIVAESFYKSAGLILGARITAAAGEERALRTRRTPNKWFNLDAPELECIAENVAHWRRGNIRSPLIIQIILRCKVQPHSVHDECPEEQLMEQWRLEYNMQDPPTEHLRNNSCAVSRRQAAYQDTHAIYKRMVIFQRSLYTYVRMLPAFKIFKALKRNPWANYDMVCRIAPCSGDLSDNCSTFKFGAIETETGCFQVSVAYAADINLPSLESKPIAQQTNVILDYIQQPPPPAPGKRTCQGLSSNPSKHEIHCQGSSVDQHPQSTQPCRHSWASNPVTVAKPQWPDLPTPHLVGSIGHSLLPKNTPWPCTASADKEAAIMCSPTSTLRHPASVPSVTCWPSTMPEDGASRTRSLDAVRENTMPALVCNDSAVEANYREVDYQTGFDPPRSEVPRLRSAMAPRAPLAQGGITAAAAAGYMKPLLTSQATQGTRESPQPPNTVKDCGLSALPIDSGSGCGARSSPMCIPGASLFRNQSSSQLPKSVAHDEQSICGAGVQAKRDTVLSAPEIQLSQMTNSMCPKERVDSWKQHLAREVQMDNKTEKPELRACGRQREPSPASFKSNCSDCSISHTYMSCSPQLPFALTPASTSHSLLQRSGEKLLGGHSYRQDSHFDSSADPAAGNLVIGRDVSDLALIRRSSWSAKSFLHSELHWLGQSPCSFSPSPTADIYPCVAGASSSASQLFSGGAGLSPSSEGNHELDHDIVFSMGEVREDECDYSLPFALEDCLEDCSKHGSNSKEFGTQGCDPILSDSMSMNTDAAAGALARMLQEAPPLRSESSESKAGPQLETLLADVEHFRRQLCAHNLQELL